MKTQSEARKDKVLTQLESRRSARSKYEFHGQRLIRRGNRFQCEGTIGDSKLKQVLSIRLGLRFFLSFPSYLNVGDESGPCHSLLGRAGDALEGA